MGVGVGEWGGSVYLSILGGYMYMYCTVPKGPLRASTSFFGGEVFTFFFLDRVGELAAAAEEEKCFGSFYICFFWRGRFWYCCCCCWVLLGSLSLSFFLSFFLSRAGEFEEGLEEGREKEKRERQYKAV